MSKEQALKDLARSAQVPLESLKEFSALDEQQLRALIQSIDAAYRMQEQGLTAAIEGALSYVPALLRGAVKKIVFG